MPQRKFSINHNAFSEYTPESAYWAGFLAADGNLRVSHSGCKQIRIYLKKSDSIHLEKFKKFLQSEHKVSLSPSYDRCSFEFTSEKIFDDLTRLYNITPTKSFTLKPPTGLPENLIRHYVRGVFDGDGTVGETFTNRNSLMATIFFAITGTEELINFIFNWSESKIGSINYKIVNHPRSMGIKVFNLTTNQTLQILSVLYEDSSEEIRLDRKFEIFNRLISGIRKTRELLPYDQRNVCLTDRRRGKKTSLSAINKEKRQLKTLKTKDDGIV